MGVVPDRVLAPGVSGLVLVNTTPNRSRDTFDNATHSGCGAVSFACLLRGCPLLFKLFIFASFPTSFRYLVMPHLTVALDTASGLLSSAESFDPLARSFVCPLPASALVLAQAQRDRVWSQLPRRDASCLIGRPIGRLS